MKSFALDPILGTILRGYGLYPENETEKLIIEKFIQKITKPKIKFNRFILNIIIKEELNLFIMELYLRECGISQDNTGVPLKLSENYKNCNLLSM